MNSVSLQISFKFCAVVIALAYSFTWSALLCGGKRRKKRSGNVHLMNIRKLGRDSPQTPLPKAQRSVSKKAAKKKSASPRKPVEHDVFVSPKRQKSSVLSLDNSLCVPRNRLLSTIKEESDESRAAELLEGEKLASFDSKDSQDTSTSFSWLTPDELLQMEKRKNQLMVEYKGKKQAKALDFGSVTSDSSSLSSSNSSTSSTSSSSSVSCKTAIVGKSVRRIPADAGKINVDDRLQET